MLSLIKNDIKLLRWSEVFKKTIIISILIVLSNVFTVVMTIMGISGFGVKLGEGLGFTFNYFTRESTFAELMVGSLANTLYFWIIVLMVITSYIVKDTLLKKQIAHVANMSSPFKLFLSKLIVGSIYISVLYILTISFSAIINYSFVKCTINFQEIMSALMMLGLNLLAILTFVWLCSAMSVLFNSCQYTHLMAFIFFFAGGFYELMAIAKSYHGMIRNIISGINSFVYTMYFSAYNTSLMVPSLYMYSLIGILVSIIISKYILEKRDYI